MNFLRSRVAIGRLLAGLNFDRYEPVLIDGLVWRAWRLRSVRGLELRRRLGHADSIDRVLLGSWLEETG